jgi:hypothetical protein
LFLQLFGGFRIQYIVLFQPPAPRDINAIGEVAKIIGLMGIGADYQCNPEFLGAFAVDVREIHAVRVPVDFHTHIVFFAKFKDLIEIDWNFFALF